MRYLGLVGLVLIGMLLVGCDGTYTPQAMDLRGTRQAVDLALQRTADAQQLIQASATLAAAETDQASQAEMERLQVGMTATAVGRMYAAQDATATQLAGLMATAEAQTATAWPATAQAQQRAMIATATAEAQAVVAADAKAKAARQWADVGLFVLVFLVVLALGGALALFGWFVARTIHYDMSVRIPAARAQGAHFDTNQGPIFVESVGGETRYIMPLLQAGSVLAVGEEGERSAGYSPDQVMHALTLWMRHQESIAASLAQSPLPAAQERVIRMLDDEAAPQLGMGELPPVAPWSIVENWRGPGLALGVDEMSQPVIVDPETTPHLLVAGTSGTGKTRGILLPVVVQALNSGWNVVLVNDRAADFATVRSHPALSNPSKDNEAKVEMIERVAEEVRQRDRVLRDARATTWSRLPSPPPPLMLVVDEIVSFAWTLRSTSPDLAKRLWSAVITITSEGRKMAVMFVGATTDPTYRTLGREGLTMRENCGRVAMRMKNAAQSRAILDEPSAESLDRFEFVAALGFGDQVRGRAFSPEDHQLLHAISRPVIRDLPPLELPEPPQADADGEADDTDARIIELYLEGRSSSDIQRALGWTVGGGNYYRVQRVIDAYKATNE